MKRAMSGFEIARRTYDESTRHSLLRVSKWTRPLLRRHVVRLFRSVIAREATPSLNSEFKSRLLQPIVRGFLRNHHVVHVRFAQAGGGHAQEARLLLELPNVVTAGVAHA